MNIFEQAARQRLRYPSARGGLTTEQLWDLPLTSKSGFSLDETAKEINAQLKQTDEESFVSASSNPARTELALKLEIVKHVIADKLAENERRNSAAVKAAERQKLLGILERKQTEELEGLSKEEIEQRINALN